MGTEWSGGTKNFGGRPPSLNITALFVGVAMVIVALALIAGALAGFGWVAGKIADDGGGSEEVPRHDVVRDIPFTMTIDGEQVEMLCDVTTETHGDDPDTIEAECR